MKRKETSIPFQLSINAKSTPTKGNPSARENQISENKRPKFEKSATSDYNHTEESESQVDLSNKRISEVAQILVIRMGDLYEDTLKKFSDKILKTCEEHFTKCGQLFESKRHEFSNEITIFHKLITEIQSEEEELSSLKESVEGFMSSIGRCKRNSMISNNADESSTENQDENQPLQEQEQN